MKQLKTLFAAPLGIYSLYSLMNDDLYDVPSKVSLLIGIGGYAYLMNHVSKIRAFDAQTIHIDKNFENFYLGFAKTSYTEKHENLGTDGCKNPIETQILESINPEHTLRFVKVPQSNILFFGFSKVLDYINEGYRPEDAIAKHKKKKSSALEREDKNPIIGTLKELWGSRNEPLSMVFWSEEAQCYTVSEIRLDCLESGFDEKVDYLQNLAEGYSTQFFD